jgi:hypothetical protein
MSEEQNPNPETTTRRSTWGEFVGLGFISSMLTAMIMLYYGQRNVNYFWTITVTTLAVCAALPLLSHLIWRKTKWQLFSNITGVLFGAIVLNLLVLEVGLMTTYGWYQNIPELHRFAEENFSQFDSNNTGAIDNKTLKAIVDKQAKLQQDVDSLAKAEVLIKSTDLEEEDKSTEIQGLHEKSAKLQARMLPEDLYQRVNRVSNTVSAAGHKVASDPQGQTYAVTRDELLHFDEKMQREYPIWLVK